MVSSEAASTVSAVHNIVCSRISSTIVCDTGIVGNALVSFVGVLVGQSFMLLLISLEASSPSYGVIRSSY